MKQSTIPMDMDMDMYSWMDSDLKVPDTTHSNITMQTFPEIVWHAFQTAFSLPAKENKEKTLRVLALQTAQPQPLLLLWRHYKAMNLIAADATLIFLRKPTSIRRCPHGWNASRYRIQSIFPVWPRLRMHSIFGGICRRIWIRIFLMLARRRKRSMRTLDSQGNVLSRAIYEDLVRERLLEGGTIMIRSNSFFSSSFLGDEYFY